jgi:tagatose 1,6-diphosphate aldolase
MRAGLEGDSVDYMRGINALTEEQARPWHTHPCYGADGPALRPANASFRASYDGFDGDGGFE